MNRTLSTLLTAACLALSSQTGSAADLSSALQPQAVTYLRALPASPATLPAPDLIAQAPIVENILPGALPLGTTAMEAHAAASLPAATPAPRFKLAFLSEALAFTPAALKPPVRASAAESLADRLPSTPVALLSLLLMLCILVGRRNRIENI